MELWEAAYLNISINMGTNWVRLLDESTLDDPHKVIALLWWPIDSHSKDIAANIELTDITKGIEVTNLYNFLRHNFNQ